MLASPLSRGGTVAAFGRSSPPEAVVAPPTPESPGRFRLALGAPDDLSALEARLVLDTVASGADVLLVCGDNRLDAYGLLALARARGLEAEAADGVWLARAFTVHQFVALLEETLPQLARERRVGLALVTGFLEPFLDEDVPPAEGRVLLARSVRRLDAWSAGLGAPVVATSSPSGPRAQQFAALAEEALGAPALMTGHARAAPAMRRLESFFPRGVA